MSAWLRVVQLRTDSPRCGCAVPSLTESTDIGGMVLSKLKVTYEVTDDIWYYPVPLTNLKGMSLDIHFATTASLLIAQKRPWWSIVIALAGFGMLAFAMYDHIVVRKRTSMQGVSEGEIEATLFSIAGSLSVLGPMLFLFLKVYSKGEPKPRQQQERRVTLGVKDPITVRTTQSRAPPSPVSLREACVATNFRPGWDLP